MMATDMRRVNGLTWIGWLNFCVLQWLFVRLVYEVDIDGSRLGDVVGWSLRRMRPLKNWHPGWWMVIPAALSLPVVVVATLYLRG